MSSRRVMRCHEMMRDCSGRDHPGQSTCRGRLSWGRPTTWRLRSWCNLRRATTSQQVTCHSQLHPAMSQCRRPNMINLPSCSCKVGHAGCTNACSTAARFWHGEGNLSLAASMLMCACILQTSGPLGWCYWSWQGAKCPWRAAPSQRSSWTLCMAMRPACRRVAAHTNTQR